MKIVIDTNIFYNNWFLDSLNFKLLKSFLHKTNASLFVPKIVFEEVINKYKEGLKKCVAEYHKILKNLNRYLFFVKTLEIETIEIETISHEYSKFLQNKLKDFNVKIINYKDIPHEDIVQRELQRKAPYEYRDILIWETILRKVISLDDKTILITDDDDFKKEELLNEIKTKFLTDSPEKYFEIFNSLKKFVNEYVKPTLEKLEKIKKQIQENTYRLFSVQEWIENNKDKIIEVLKEKFEFIKHKKPFSSYQIDYIEISDIIDVIEFKVLDVYQIENKKILVDLNLILEVELDLFIFKPGAYWILDDEISWISISNFDWNEHYALGHAYVSLPVSLSIIINTEKGKIESYQADLVEFYGFCPKCGSPVLSSAAESCYQCGKKFFLNKF